MDILSDAWTSFRVFLAKDRALTAWQAITEAAATPKMRLAQAFSGTDGQWTGNTTMSTGTRYTLVWSYDNTSLLNDPLMWLNRLAQTVTEDATPTLTADADATLPLVIGENGAGGGDFDGRMAGACYDSVAWTQHNVDAYHNWGIPRGGHTCKVWHPLLTSSLVNKGAATADLTATGTTMANNVPAMHGLARLCSN